MLQLFSKLNICAILYATVGGFSSLIALTGFTAVRAFNRISIYMMFISLSVLFLCIQKLDYALQNKGNEACRMGFAIALVFAFVVCLFDLLPTYGAADGGFEDNLAKYQSDKNFVEEIEARLEPGDSVFQLPYEQYQEGGNKNQMPMYHEFVGYLHSKNLKWSFGGVRNRESDLWNRYVSSIPSQLQIDALIRTGFRGIYIEALAYTTDELAQLRGLIETVLQEQPLISGDGTLLFYDLYPYASAHPREIALGPVRINDPSVRYFTAKTLFATENAVIGTYSIELPGGTAQFGPYITCEPGDYKITVYGDNLDVCDYDAAYDAGINQIERLNAIQGKEQISYEIHVSETISNVEFRVINNSDQTVTVDYIEMSKK